MRSEVIHTVWVSYPAVCSLVRGCTLGRSREFSTSTCDLSSRAVAYTIYSVMPLPVSELGGNLCSRIAWQSVPRVALCMHTTGCAPCYSNSYEGSTTWWVVRTEDREKLEKYIVTRARQWYNVPVSVQLSKVEEDALAGLLYTKHVVFHPSDLVAAGIRVTKVVQVAGTVVVGLGDAVHFGMCSVPADHVRQRRSAETGRSVNEAVNFIPVQWLGDGLLRYAEWMQWLQRSWITVQRDGSMRQAGTAAHARCCSAQTHELPGGEALLVPLVVHVLQAAACTAGRAGCCNTNTTSDR